MRHYEFF